MATDVPVSEMIEAWSRMLEISLADAREIDEWISYHEVNRLIPCPCGALTTDDHLAEARIVSDNIWLHCQHAEAVINDLKRIDKLTPGKRVSIMGV
jgi:hypothetical protein